MGHQRFARDLVLLVDIDRAILDQMTQERSDVAGIHLAGMKRDGRRNIERPDDADPALHDRLARLSKLAVAATLGSDIYDDRAWRHAGYHLSRNQDRGFLSGHGRSGNQNVLLAHNFGQDLALLAIEIFP